MTLAFTLPYLAALLALLLLPGRLGLSPKRLAAQLGGPPLIYATILIATGRIVPLEGGLKQIPLLLFLYGGLVVEALLFLSAPLIVTALAVETLRVRYGWHHIRLILAAALLTPLCLSPLGLPLSYVAAVTLCELLLIVGMEFTAKRP